MTPTSPGIILRVVRFGETGYRKESEIAIRPPVHQRWLHLHFATTMRINRQMACHLQTSGVERWVNIPHGGKQTDWAAPTRPPDRLHLSRATVKTVDGKSQPAPPLGCHDLSPIQTARASPRRHLYAQQTLKETRSVVGKTKLSVFPSESTTGKKKKLKMTKDTNTPHTQTHTHTTERWYTRAS